jgi:SSS family solute:Na+ symporter
MAMQSYLRVIAPQFAGWLPVAAALAVVIYTSIGGYKGVAVTDILKMVVLVIGVAIFASIVLSRTPEASWQQLPAKHWGLTGYGIVFMIGALVFFPPTILVRSDLWQRVVHAESPQAARKALGWTIPSLIAFYAVLTLIGMASRARLGIDTPKESAGLLLLNTDITGLPIGSAFAGIVVAVISFGIFAALASTADNNLNIAAIGLSKLLFRRDWSRVQAERQSSTPAQNTSTEATLLVKCRVLCLIVGFGSVGSALFLKDIVAVMVNAASVMLLFLPATLGALLFGHHSKHGGIFSILLGLVTYIAILALGVPLKSAFVPGFVVALLVYMTILKIEKNWRPPHAAQGGIP